MIAHLDNQSENLGSTMSVLDFLQLGLGLAPLPGMNAASMAVSGLHGHLSGKKDLAELMQTTGANSITDLENLAGRNDEIRKKLDAINGSMGVELGSNAVGLVGGGIGAAVGSAMLPFAGTLIGGAAGNIVTQWLYDNATTEQKQESFNIASQIEDKRQQGQRVSPEELFMAMAANLPEDKRKPIEDLLFKQTGTRDFRKALEGNDPSSFTKLMHDSDEIMRAAKGMHPDPANPTKTVPEIFAEMLNRNPEMKTMDALINKEDMGALLKVMQHRQMSVADSDVTGRIGFGNNVPNLRSGKLSK